MEDAVTVEYFSREEISKVVQRVLVEKGITDEDLEATVLEADGDLGNKLSILDPSPSLPRSETDSVLGELFVSSPPGSPALTVEVSRAKFLQSVLMMKGLVAVLSSQVSLRDKEEILDIDVLKPESEEDHMVFVILTFTSSYLFSSHSHTDTKKWIQEAIRAILDILDEAAQPQQSFLSDTVEICREFVESTLHSAAAFRSEEKISSVSHVIGMFGSNKMFAHLIITFIIEKFLMIGDLLREAERFKLEDKSSLETFHVYNKIMLEVWPAFVQGNLFIYFYFYFTSSLLTSFFIMYPVICDPSPGGGRRKEKASRAAARLSLGETTGLVAELRAWRGTLAEVTAGLSVLQPGFYLAITNLDHLVSGAALKLSKQKQ